MLDLSETVTTFWPNGVKRFELMIQNGLPHGILRTWYNNGLIEKEIDYKNGAINGPWKIWSKTGRFIGKFSLISEDEYHVTFSADGSIEHISEYSNGVLHGRFFHQATTTAKEFENFYIYGRQVSKKGYIKACEFDRTLPPYEGDPDEVDDSEVAIRKEINEWKVRQRELRSAQMEPAHKEIDLPLPSESEFVREALQWLNEPSEVSRLLHKRYYTDECVLIIEEGYAAGCKKIWAVDIETNEYESNARRLLVEVPADGKQRESALDWVVRMINGNMGFPPDDRGQTFFVIGLC